jgi:hypothetical protein
MRWDREKNQEIITLAGVPGAILWSCPVHRTENGRSEGRGSETSFTSFGGAECLLG